MDSGKMSLVPSNLHHVLMQNKREETIVLMQPLITHYKVLKVQLQY